MKKATGRFANIYFGLFLILCFDAGMPLNAGWEVTAKDDGITVFSRLEGESTIKEVKVEMEVETSLESLVTFLNDVPGYKSWVYKTTVSELVETIDEHSFIYYIESDFPFPVSNRDMVISSSQVYDRVNKTMESISVAVANKMEEKKGLVRITEFQSHWKVHEIEENKVKIEYQAKTDPAGYIPTWIINMAIGTAPLKTMKALRSELEG